MLSSFIECVLLLAVVYTIVMKILPLLIYQEESKNWKDYWIENISDNIVYFVLMPTEWSNNSIGK